MLFRFKSALLGIKFLDLDINDREEIIARVFQRQREEIRGRKSEVGGQKSEVRGRRSEIGDQKSELARR